tara:strand:+ start:5562 stop:6275 length:714 start_codon:yes stop_codon:yes gene_type:complete
MTKKKENTTETTVDTAVTMGATNEIVEGSPSALMVPPVGGTITGDIDASDISFPRLQILQGISKLAQEDGFSAGDIVLDGEAVLDQPVEFTVARIGKMYEENVNWDDGEIPRILTKADAVAAGGNFEWGMNGEKPDWVPIADALICIKGDDPDVFPFDHDKEHYAFALWRIKGVAYKRAAVQIFTAARMYYRDGLDKGTFQLTTDKQTFSGKTVIVPKLKRGGKNTEAFSEWLRDFS